MMNNVKEVKGLLEEIKTELRKALKDEGRFDSTDVYENTIGKMNIAFPLNGDLRLEAAKILLDELNNVPEDRKFAGSQIDKLLNFFEKVGVSKDLILLEDKRFAREIRNKRSFMVD